MTTMITGVGLIGTAAAECAIARGERVVFLDSEPRAEYLREKLGKAADVRFVRRDVRDLPSLVETMSANEVEVVVHTAGLIGGRVSDPLYTGFQINMGGTMNVCEAVRLASVRRLVHVSTNGVYDRRVALSEPIKESHPLWADRGYPASKVANELIVNTYAKQYGFELAVIRPAGVYGYGHYGGGSGIGQAMHTLMLAAIGRSQLQRVPCIAGVEFIYTKDVGSAVDAASIKPLGDAHTFNVGNGYVTTSEELIEAVQAAVPGANVGFEDGGGEGAKVPMDIGAAKTHLGWSPSYSVADGLADYAGELRRVLG